MTLWFSSSSWRAAFAIGGASVRANAIPMAFLWMTSALCVGLYYGWPPFAVSLEPVAHWQCESGPMAAFLNRFIFCGAVPGVFLISVRTLRPRHPLATVLAQGVWGGVSGVVYDVFYRGQALLFGTDLGVLTLLKKMLVDQFVMTPFVVAPLNVLVFFWISHDFDFRSFRDAFPRPFITRALLPNLVMNWCVWIPVVLAIYAFPLALQVQVSGLICSFWALMCLDIGRRSSSSRRVS